MKYHIVLIRHGATPGNLEKRYIGLRTDEGLSIKGREELFYCKLESGCSDNRFDCVFTGAMRRCRETAEILFPGKEVFVLPGMTEIDFGEFENLNYQDLSGNENYQAWIDSNGTLPYPGGETREAFSSRTMKCFMGLLETMKEKNARSAALICHGGNIMAIMSFLTNGEYFDYQVKNGKGYVLDFEANGDSIFEVSFSGL